MIIELLVGHPSVYRSGHAIYRLNPYQRYQCCNQTHLFIKIISYVTGAGLLPHWGSSSNTCRSEY